MSQDRESFYGAWHVLAVEYGDARDRGVSRLCMPRNDPEPPHTEITAYITVCRTGDPWKRCIEIPVPTSGTAKDAARMFSEIARELRALS